jgi:hypothetical protein
MKLNSPLAPLSLNSHSGPACPAGRLSGICEAGIYFYRLEAGDYKNEMSFYGIVEIKFLNVGHKILCPLQMFPNVRNENKMIL